MDTIYPIELDKVNNSNRSNSSLKEYIEDNIQNGDLNINTSSKHQHKEKGGDKGHGHSHGEKKQHGRSHGGQGGGGGEKKVKSHGHSHGSDEEREGGHGHSHGGHNEDDDHDHEHGDDDTQPLSPSLLSRQNSQLRRSIEDDHDDHGHHGDEEEEDQAKHHAKKLEELRKKRNARISLVACLMLTTLFMIGEVIGGYLANSLAIMSDAAHLLTDIAAMFLSLFAMWISSHKPTSKLSFGFHRAEILGALVSVLMIWALTGVLLYEAVQRVIHPPDHVDGKIMFIIATCGLLINIIDAVILHFGAGGHGHSHGGGGAQSHGHGHGGKKKKVKSNDHGHAHNNYNQSDNDHQVIEIDINNPNQNKKDKKKDQKIKMDINVYSTYIHVIGDCFQSIGVMIASAIIWARPSWKIADPITTFIFSIIVLFTTIRLLKQSLGVLMEGVPSDIDVNEVQHDLEGLEGVTEVHDLHIWSITLNKPALSVHLTVGPSIIGDEVLKAANRLLKNQHNIDHTTIQVEIQTTAKPLCRDPCVKKVSKKDQQRHPLVKKNSIGHIDE